MKKTIALLLALALCFSLVACSSNTPAQTPAPTAAAPAQESAAAAPEAPAADEYFELNVCIGYTEPHTMDPTIATGADQFEILFHTFEGLMKFAPSSSPLGTNPNQMGFEVVPGQAESYEYDEATMTYTFHLRDDIFWYDGQPVTAQDFVYSWQRLVNPETAATNGKMFNNIVLNAAEIYAGEMEPSELGVKAVDDKTLTVTLANPCAYFLNLLTHYGSYPLRQDYVETGSTWTEPATFMSNGAYRMVEWVHDSYMAIEKNETYYDYENLGPDRIVFNMSDNSTSILAAYQAGEYSMAYGVPADQIQPLAASGDLFLNPRLSMTYLYLSVDNIPDWRVRAALMLAIDRDNIVENVTQDGSTPTVGMIPGGLTNSQGVDWPEAVGTVMYDWLAEQYPDFDLTTYGGRCELAQELFDAAVADGYDASVTMDYYYNTSDTNRAIGEAVQADLANVLGINVLLSNVDSAGYTETISQGNFHLARLGYGGKYNDATTYLDLYGTNGNFEYSGWSNETYDKLLAEAKTTVAGPERDALLEQAEAIMFTDEGFSVSPLYYGSYPYVMDADLLGTFYSTISNLTNFSYAYRAG